MGPLSVRQQKQDGNDRRLETLYDVKRESRLPGVPLSASKLICSCVNLIMAVVCDTHTRDRWYLPGLDRKLQL